MSRCVGPTTHNAFWGSVCWCLHVLMSGKHPLRDYEGRPWAEGSPEKRDAGTELCGGYFFVPWQVRGDADYFGNYLRLNHASSLWPCPWCNCNRIDPSDAERLAAFNCDSVPW